MELLRSLPRNIVIAAVALALAVAMAELISLTLAALVPSGNISATGGKAEGVLFVSPLVLVFYAGPLLGVLREKGRVAWLLGSFFGILPGLLLGLLAGVAAYGSLVGLLAGLGAVALTRLSVGACRHTDIRE
ncbi:MAG: hypothetical protein JSR59_03430 [Proteobacteria bacterium]|nr:hypothetical protein [Pseudomonadota bacterium]